MIGLSLESTITVLCVSLNVLAVVDTTPYVCGDVLFLFLFVSRRITLVNSSVHHRLSLSSCFELDKKRSPVPSE